MCVGAAMLADFTERPLSEAVPGAESGVFVPLHEGALMNSTPRGRKIVDSMAGYNLGAAAVSMEKLERFEQEGTRRRAFS